MPPLLDAAGGIRRVQELLDTRPAVVEAVDAAPLPTVGRSITFSDVVFSYDGRHRCLDGVSFAIPAGANVAVVGASGSGRSTVLGVVACSYDPDSGTVSFDDADLRAGTVQSLRDQRQRAAIARAILRDPAVLLLDEATSALDPATEISINATLKRLAADRTVISVTHRLTATSDADLILVMEGGRLVESGPRLTCRLPQGRTGGFGRASPTQPPSGSE